MPILALPGQGRKKIIQQRGNFARVFINIYVIVAQIMEGTMVERLNTYSARDKAICHQVIDKSSCFFGVNFCQLFNLQHKMKIIKLKTCIKISRVLTN